MKIKERKVEIFLLIFSLLVYSYFINSFHSPNEGSRYALIKAIVDDGNFVVDKYRNYSGIDVTFYKGNYYSDKVPGLSFLGIPVYVIGQKLGFSEDSQFFNSLVLLTTVISSISLLIVYKISRNLSFSILTSFVLSLVYGFGTVAWVFSKTFFAHSYSAFFLLLGVNLIVLNIKKNRNTLFLAGVSFGLLVLMEYTNFIMSFLFIVFLFFVKSKKQLLVFVIPFLLFVGVILLYQYSIFGNPFFVTYNFHYSYGNTLDTQWFKSTKIIEGTTGLLFSKSIGLFYMSPILLLSFFGIKKFFRREKLLCLIFLLSFLSIFIFYSSSEAWHGGNSYGPRYLLVVIPFLIFPLGFIIEKHKKVFAFWIIFLFLFSYSAVYNGAGALYDPAPAESLKDPFIEHNLPNLIKGDFDSYFYRQNNQSFLMFILLIFILISYFGYDQWFEGKRKRKLWRYFSKSE